MKKVLKVLIPILMTAQPALSKGRVQNEDIKSLSDITASVLSTTGTVTSSSACITSIGSTTGLAVGQYVYDTTNAYIPSGTTIAGLPGTCSTGQVQMSASATGSSTGDTITFGGQASSLINDTKIWSTAVTPPQQLSSAITSGLIGAGGGGNGKNYLQDPSFEAYPTGSYWTVTTATGAADTTNFTDGSQSLKLTFAGTTGSVVQTVTPSTQLSSVNMQATCYVKTSQSGVNLCAQVGGSDVNCQAVPSSGNWTPVTSSFIGPASGSIGIDVKATSAITGTVNVDACYVGKAVPTAVAQPQLIGTATVTGCSSNWSTSSTTFAAFSAVSGCSYSTTGALLAPSTNIPGFKVASLAPGDYRIEYSGVLAINDGSTFNNDRGLYQFTDGTNTAREQEGLGISTSSTNSISTSSLSQTISYSTAQSNVTLQVYGIGNSSGVSGGFATINGTSVYPGVFKLWYFPTSQQTAYRADATPANWSGYQTVASGWTTTSSTFADPAAGTTVALTQLTNRNFGTVSSAASSLPGVLATLPRAGTYKVCATVTLSDSSVGTMSARLVDGSSTVINAGVVVPDFSAGSLVPAVVCGDYVSATGGATTFKLQLAVSTGTASIANGLVSGSPAISWSILEEDAPMPAPYLTGSVTSNTSGQEHVERVTVSASCTSTPCTIASQSGSWLSSISRSATGSYTLNIAAGEFSSAPTCTCNVGSVGSAVTCENFTSASSTAISFATVNSSATLTDGSFNVICMGPR